jgi:hypothetical protein
LKWREAQTRALSLESARVTGSVVVVMDNGLAYGAVTMLFLDDGRPLARLALPDHRAIAIAITVTVVTPVTLADGYAGANRTNANANLIRKGRARKGANGRGNHQNLLHRVLLHGTGDKRPIMSAVPVELAQTTAWSHATERGFREDRPEIAVATAHSEAAARP